MIGSYDMAKVVLRKKSLNNVEGGPLVFISVYFVPGIGMRFSVPNTQWKIRLTNSYWNLKGGKTNIS
jgi:hypothetical protein